MAIDGEWRAGFIDDAGVDFEYGVAPFPVPDDQADTYGKGYLSGTIIGIASTSEKQNAAWELVKYLTTDTEAVVSFANAIHNVPSTIAALKSPDLDDEPRRRDVHRDRPEPEQQHDAGQPQRRRLPADPAGCRLRLRVRQGDRPASGPRRGGRADRHRHRTGASKHVGSARPARRCGSAQARRTARTVAFLSPWLLGTGLFFLYPLVSTVYFSFTKYDGFTPPTPNGLDNWKYVFKDYPFFWPALRNTLWLVLGDGDAAGRSSGWASAC